MLRISPSAEVDQGLCPFETRDFLPVLLSEKNRVKLSFCSQFVYIVFKNAGVNVHKNIDLDYNGGNWVMPFDIMYSPLLENITLSK